jgi:hypothetical protein
MTRMTPKGPDKPSPAKAPHATSPDFSWERPLGTHWLPERPFLFQESPARAASNAKPDPAVPASSA